MRNSSLVERPGVDNNRASSQIPKLWISNLLELVGEHSMCAEAAIVRCSGGHRKANVGISNDKTGEKPVHRKTKVSYSMLIRIGLVGT